MVISRLLNVSTTFMEEGTHSHCAFLLSVLESHCSVFIEDKYWKSKFLRKCRLISFTHTACWDNFTWLSHRQYTVNVSISPQLNLLFSEEVVDNLAVSSFFFLLFTYETGSYTLASLAKWHMTSLFKWNNTGITFLLQMRRQYRWFKLLSQ